MLDVSRKTPLLLCALGNPGAAYEGTRHNAGHILLELYRKAVRMPEMQRSHHGQISQAGSISLFRSGSYMNNSGSAVNSTFRDFLKQFPDGKLCLIHDDLESALGKVKLRHFGKGKGHNGIRSCLQSLGTEDFARIAVGIGRPDSRESRDVTKHVLGRFTQQEMKVLEHESLTGMFRVLDELQKHNKPPVPNAAL